MNFKGFLKKLSNKYVIVTLIFAAVIVFIDQNNVFEQGRNYDKWRKSEQELEDLTKKTDAAWQKRNGLERDTAAMERAARVLHGMKRSNEDVYLFDR